MPSPAVGVFPDTHERRGVLSTLPAQHRERRLALAVVLVSAAIFVLVAPFAKVRLAPVWAFIPVYQSALAVNDLITAVLLLGQYRILRSRGLWALATGYLFTAFIAVAHMLTFPGLFAPAGLLGAGPQSTAWLYMFWHGGFPLCVVAYTLLGDTPRPPGRARAGVVGAVVASLGAVVALTLLVSEGRGALPPIMQGNAYTPVMILVVSSTWGLSLLALSVLAWRRRPYSVLDLWLMVVLCAWLFDIALAAVLNAGRFDLGFYAGRVYGLLAASFVLMVLLIENSRLYARLVGTNEALAAEVVERRRAEADAEAANRAKSEFLSRMSHELRTPLNSVIGFGQLLEMDRLTPDQRESVERILVAGRHLLGLINEVLEISRIEAGGLRLSPEPVPVTETARSAVDLVRPLAAARGIEIETVLPDDERHVMADRQRLQQVLLNLLSNAVKYNREGGRVTVACAESGPGRLELRVTDTGRGLSEAQLAKLFTPFERLGAEQTGVEGTGLGLSLSRHLVEAMGGVLRVESRPGAGSTFAVGLSAVTAPDAALTDAAPSGDDAAAPTGGVVLCIEDNVSNLRFVERVLARRPGVTLLGARQGGEGLELARARLPRLVLLDLHLPDMPGEDVLRRLRGDPRTAGIVVVVVSADATPAQAERLRAAGADDYLTKPLDVRRFLALVDHVLAAR